MRFNGNAFPSIHASLLAATIGVSVGCAAISEAQCNRGGASGGSQTTAESFSPRNAVLLPSSSMGFEGYARSTTPSVQQIMAQQQMYAMMQQQAAYQQRLQQMWAAKQQREFEKRERRLAAARSRRLQKEQQRELERQERIAALKSSSQTS